MSRRQYYKRMHENASATRAFFLPYLRAAGVVSVVVYYDGEGDDGQLDGPFLFMDNDDDLWHSDRETIEVDDLDIPADAKIKLNRREWNTERGKWINVAAEISPTEIELQDMFYLELSNRRVGWQDGNGSQGEFVWSIALDTITWTHGIRVYEFENITVIL